MNVIILTLAVVFGNVLLANVSARGIQTINYMLPALFGALLASEIVKRPKLALYYKLGVLNFMKAFTWYRYIRGNYAVVLVTIVFSSMFFGKYLAEKGKIK